MEGLSDLVDNSGATAIDSGGVGGVFCADDWLNDRLVKLHRLARLGYGQNIQGHIDSHLPAVAFLSGNVCGLEKGALFARRMVLCISDAPQEGTLPDLGCILRSVMLGYRSSGQRCGGKASSNTRSGCDFPYAIADDCYATHMLLQALPCIRRAVNKKEEKHLQRYQIGLNILLGFMLGLCPSAVKFPPFPVRVIIYSAIHQLLTCGGGEAFCKAHPMLMTMAFMEYCAHVIPAYMPAEHEVLLGEQGMPAFFSAVPVAGDVFRQEMLNNLGNDSPVPWARLEEHCDVFVDKHTRSCKNRAKQRRDDHGVAARIPFDVVDAFCTLPFVTPYNVHLDDSTHRMLGSELAVLDQRHQPTVCECGGDVVDASGSKEWRGKHYETVAAMQRLLSVSSLPANLVRMQLRSLGVCMRVCERSALDGMMMYICVSCGLCSGGASRSAQTRGQCRLDGELFSDEWGCAGSVSRSGFICSHCQTPSVMAVNSLGRVVSLRSQRFFLAPCCCTVQVYSGAGVEFQSEYCLLGSEGAANGSRGELSDIVTLHSCPHQKKKAPQRSLRARCEVCQTASGGAVAPEVFSAVDHLTGRMHSIRLCARHAPRAEALRLVANWRQLMDEVGKRDRPLFASSRK